MAKTDSELPFIDKEISWLSFNERVLQEAGNPQVPEIQRLRYLGIFSNNQDEFFRVRVADVSRLASFAQTAEEKERYKALLFEIQDRTRELQDKFEETYRGVLRALQKRKIYIVNEAQLDDKQANKVVEVFERQVLPELDPILLDSGKSFPEINDGMIYLGIKVIDANDNTRYAIAEVPTDRLPRFFQIPQRQGRRGKVFIVLENIILHSLPRIFRGVIDVKHAEAYVFKLTRDAELELGEGINQSLVDRVANSLQKRRRGDPERFVYDRNMPEDLLKFFSKRLNLGKYDSMMPGGRYHNAKDFISFPSVGPAYLEFKPLPPLPLPELLAGEGSIFKRIRERDMLMYYPYHSFDVVIDLLKTAAIDPAVQTIKVCLYRAAKNSRIVDALLSAKRNNKEVTTVVELQARFDEAANISWARQLTDGGVNVIFGVPGLKVHSKLIVIGRKEGSETRYYAHVGTGNLNEKTANIYTDFSLLTYNQEIGQDVAKVFDFISYTYRRQQYQHLLVSPHTTRFGLVKMIKREIANAKAGLPAAITFKCNNLVDRKLIRYLYDASNAGVRIRLICRGMMSLVPGVKGLSENIEAISVVDRFLEHPRVYIFHNNGEPVYLISSADIMTRNLDYRVEVSVPILDPVLQKRIQDVIDIQWCDNVKARTLDGKQSNRYRRLKINGNVRSQEVIHRYLKDGSMPVSVKQVRKKLDRQLVNDAKARTKALEKANKAQKADKKKGSA